MAKVENSLKTAAAKAGMDAKTARKYRGLGRMPSELRPGRRWRTRSHSNEYAAGLRPATKSARSFFAVRSSWTARSAIGRLQDYHPRQNSPAGQRNSVPGAVYAAGSMADGGVSLFAALPQLI